MKMLKALAMKAKNRLINSGDEYGKIEGQIKIISKDDESFKSKVRDILSREESVVNPMQELMDENKLMKLNPMERERYLLETVEKYLSVKKELERDTAKII